MSRTLRTSFLFLLSIFVLCFAQMPFSLEQYENYIRRTKSTQSTGNTEHYQSPPIYAQDTSYLEMPEAEYPYEQMLEIAPPETLLYFDEAIIVDEETVQVIRKAVPRYLNLYGANFFEGVPKVFTAQQPVSGEYILGSGDRLLLNLWGGVDAQYELEVDREGTVYIPQVGDVAVGGLSMLNAENRVKNALAAAYSDFQANLNVASVKTIRVFVVGQVKYPGVYDLPGLSRTMTALASAGGPDSTGSFRSIVVYRNDREVAKFDVYDFIHSGHASGNIQLANGDVVVVPHYAVQVKLRGRIKTPAIYELLEQETISNLLTFSGGALPDANTNAIFVDRMINGIHKIVSIDINDTVQTTKSMCDGDDLSIFSTSPFRRKVVFLEGYVPQPGAYGWFEGMKVSDLFQDEMHLFEDTYMERINLLRLLYDGKREIIPVAFDDAIAQKPEADIELHPDDRVVVMSSKVFRRKEYVRISGAVQFPGKYELYIGMKVSDLLFITGGMREYAFPDSAELVRITNGKIIQKQNIHLQNILDNPDAPENIILRDEDYIFVRSIPEWRETQTVSILGEVNFPGNYALSSDEEKLTELIQRAGDVTEKAFLEGALFIRPGIAEEFSRRNVLRVVRGTQELTRDSLGQIDTTLLIFNWNPIDLNKMILDMNLIVEGMDDIVMEAGDTVFIPRRPDGVSVVGAIASNGTVKYHKGKNVKYYINRAGGPTRNANEDEIRLVKPNGKVLKVSMGYRDVSPGDVVVVPQKIKKEGRWLSTVKDLVAILSGVATTIYILIKL